MKIQLVQSEIEQAISNYIRETITVNEGMSITMELRATRGAEGFQADIDISRTSDVPTAVVAKTAAPAAAQAPRAATKAATVGQPTNAPAPKPAAAPQPQPEQPVEPEEPEQLPDDDTEVTGAVDQAQKPVEDSEEASSSPAADPTPATEPAGEAAPVKRSLFAGLKKPVNPA